MNCSDLALECHCAVNPLLCPVHATAVANPVFGMDSPSASSSNGTEITSDADMMLSDPEAIFGLTELIDLGNVNVAALSKPPTYAALPPLSAFYDNDALAVLGGGEVFMGSAPVFGLPPSQYPPVGGLDMMAFTGLAGGSLAPAFSMPPAFVARAAALPSLPPPLVPLSEPVFPPAEQDNPLGAAEPLNVQDGNGCTPVAWAVCLGNLPALRYGCSRCVFVLLV